MINLLRKFKQKHKRDKFDIMVHLLGFHKQQAGAKFFLVKVHASLHLQWYANNEK